MSRHLSSAVSVAGVIAATVSTAILPTPAATAATPPAPPPSTWAATIEVGATNTVRTVSDGDLWPTCWASDNSLYTAWGDGRGFNVDGRWVDVGTARIDGGVGDLTGTNTALSEQVSTLWNPGKATRKPTGAVCVGNTIYLAIQDLSLNFSEAYAATIVKSTDGGKTWTWDKSKPMFSNSEFTTIWFADFGKGGEWNTSDYIYAYALDGNWRDSPPPFNDVPDPQDLYLARVPKNKVQQRNQWQFFAGYAKNKVTPTWTHRIANKAPIMHDSRRDYAKTFPDGGDGLGTSVLGQGGVIYDKPLNRYIYSSWSEWTMHFYESPTPWGPWRAIGDQDFTGLDNRLVQYSGYGTSLISKFLSADGKTLMMQSNRCCGGTVGYEFGLRPITLQLAKPGVANPSPSTANLATDPTAVTVSKSVRQGSLTALSDGNPATAVDDFDNEVKGTSWWGYTWPQAHTANQLTFTTGPPRTDGGWFITVPRVQYRVNGLWTDVPTQVYDRRFVLGSAGGGQTWTVSFPAVVTDGIRVIGTPGGDHTYSSMAELSVRFVNALLIDGGFENTSGYTGAWRFSGTVPHGIDMGCCAHTGSRNAWIRTDTAAGQQLVYQSIRVQPGTKLAIHAWMQYPSGVHTLYLGARWAGGTAIGEFGRGGAAYAYYPYAQTVTVPAGVRSIDVVAGYSADGGDVWVQVDDVTVTIVG